MSLIVQKKTLTENLVAVFLFKVQEMRFPGFKRLSFSETDPSVCRLEEWPKSAPFFFSATLLLVLNPSFFGVCKWNFPSRMKSIVFIFSTIRLL